MEQTVIEKKKHQRMPDARGYNIVDGYAERLISETRKERSCFLCGDEIPIGSRAREYIEVVNRKLLVNNKKYAHTAGECPPIKK